MNDYKFFELLVLSYINSWFNIDLFSQGIFGNSNEIKTLILSDNSGYFVVGFDFYLKAIVCKYLFSVSSTADCQQLPSIFIAYGHLILSSSELIISGSDLTTTNLDIIKFTFGAVSTDWAMKMSCSSTCYMDLSESFLSADKATVNFFFVYGSTKYLYYVRFATASGSVIGTRYKSSILWSQVYGSVIQGDYVLCTAGWSSQNLVIFNTISSTFIIKSFSDSNLYNLASDSLTGR